MALLPTGPGILRLRQSGTASQRITLAANGRVFGAWTAVELERDVADLAATATLELWDPLRSRRAFPRAAYTAQDWEALACGTKVVLAIDGEDVLRGWVEAVALRVSGDQIAASVVVADDAAHLVECDASPRGPHEFRNLTVLQFAERICRPFGIGVQADVDVGAPFATIGIDVSETALSAIEKLARQRALLVTSDGLGNVVLTRGGQTAAPAPLRLGEGLDELVFKDSWRGRFSDYYVKGQSTPQRGARLDGAANPLTSGVATPPPLQVERAGAVMTGHSQDAEVTLYRPTVRQAKTQSGGATVQEQADWMARIARGKGQGHILRVLDWRAGAARELWRPNTRVLVDDPFGGVLEERLIGAVVYRYAEDGETTRLRVVRPGAYDLDPAVRERRRDRRPGRAADGTARPLVAS
ncbi:phage baseplate assembly protein [Falsiroseomonas sp.]|uniref:phage baseplate assembly protein n=1 Tax=Falsiroseomonas sp. TaxID=2870721 RepID=UPI0027246541|nr:hypothetical protein [Falsiroseomonas sp.]MDO9501384.1 hypothetical protein [Falsiroseomonas sp.]